MNGLAFEAWLRDAQRPPLLMGVLNVTPDSFSDGGRFFDAGRAAERAAQMVADGAGIVDVGGESTRPGSLPVTAAEQIRRVVPVIEAIRELDAVVSVDTTDADVAEAALDAGATMINDVSAGLHDPRLFRLAARRTAPIVLMHMLGTPPTMQTAPHYADVVAEVRSFLASRASAATATGIAPHRVLLDVGIGFGKTLAHNLSLLKRHATFAELGFATVLGTSRKGFIGKLTGVERPEDRAFGTAATLAWGIAAGANVLRVHDVAEMRQVRDVIVAIREAQ